MSDEKHKCCKAMIRGDCWHPRYEQCGKTAKAERGGKWYCGIHDPEAIAAKESAKKSERREQMQLAMERDRHNAAAPDLYEACKLAINKLENASKFTEVGDLDSLRAAIAKYKGKQP